MNSNSKTSSFFDNILKYWQILIAFIAIIVGWTLANNRIDSLERESVEHRQIIEKLQSTVDLNKTSTNDFEKETLQRLSSMEAKIDFLVEKTSTRASAPIIENENSVQANVNISQPASSTKTAEIKSTTTTVPTASDPDIHFIMAKYFETNEGATTNDFFEWYFSK